MREYKQFYINGQWVDPTTPHDFDVINPATEEVCAHISLGIRGGCEQGGRGRQGRV